MEIQYVLEKYNYVIHQLYIASKSEKIKQKRLKSKTIFPVLYFIIGIVFLIIKDYPSGLGMIILGALWYFIYPLWEKRHYVKYYTAFINENYPDKLDQVITLVFENEYIFTKDAVCEGRVLLSEIVEINEINKLIFIKLKNGGSYILPKERIQNIDEVKGYLRSLAEYLNIPYQQEQDWQWK